MPNRIIKESICYSEDVNKLSWAEEVFFYRLIVHCDDYGRLDARPAILKAKLFPLKDITAKQVETFLNKLVTVGMVRVYEYDRQPFLQLLAWEKHQQIRAKKSKYPAPDKLQLMIDDELNNYSSEINGNQMISDVPVIQSESESEYTPLPPLGESDGEIKLKLNEILIDIDKYFEDTYSEYPNKTADKQQGKKLYLQYLTTGKRIKGSPTLKFNHAQMRVAIQEYSSEVEGRDMQYIKNFYNFLNEKLPGYVEKTIEKYEIAIQNKYPENWQKIKFKYTGMGIDK